MLGGTLVGMFGMLRAMYGGIPGGSFGGIIGGKITCIKPKIRRNSISWACGIFRFESDELDIGPTLLQRTCQSMICNKMCL